MFLKNACTGKVKNRPRADYACNNNYSMHSLRQNA